MQAVAMIPLILGFLISLCVLTPRGFSQVSDDSLETIVEISERSSHIVIARCEKLMRVPNNEYFPKSLAEYVVTLKVEAVLKGERELKSVRVRHFQYVSSATTVANGPSFMYFGPNAYRAARELATGDIVDVPLDDNYQLCFLDEDGTTGLFVPTSSRHRAGESTFGLKGIRVGSNLLDKETSSKR